MSQLRGRILLTSSGWKPRMLLNATVNRTVPTTKSEPDPSANSVKVEKPYISHVWLLFKM